MWITEHLLHVTQMEACGSFYKVIQHPDLFAMQSRDIIIQRDAVVISVYLVVAGFGEKNNGDEPLYD